MWNLLVTMCTVLSRTSLLCLYYWTHFHISLQIPNWGQTNFSVRCSRSHVDPPQYHYWKCHTGRNVNGIPLPAIILPTQTFSLKPSFMVLRILSSTSVWDYLYIFTQNILSFSYFSYFISTSSCLCNFMGPNSLPFDIFSIRLGIHTGKHFSSAWNYPFWVLYDWSHCIPSVVYSFHSWDCHALPQLPTHIYQHITF